MKNIIFIEGISGIGKTTTVNKLGSELTRRGYSVKCYNEGDFDSPLDLCWTAYLETREYEDLRNLYPMFAEEFSRNVIYNNEYVLLRYQIGQSHLYSREIRDELHKREFCYNPLNGGVSLLKFTEVFVKLWQKFAEDGGVEVNYDYMIFDASLVSHMTNDLIRNYNASRCEIVEHLEMLIDTVRLMNPVVFLYVLR